MFETRNPLVREWEDWHIRYSGEVVDPAGAVVHCAREVETLTDAGLVVVERYGDWGRGPLTEASPEIVTVARRG
ncbi:hypothetical protein [Streptomyces sp. YKOK-I1]